MSTKMTQKDYLKKYLSSDKNTDNRKKKKKTKTIAQSVKIIDDDIDLSKLHHIADEDLEVYAIGEDAPQIVGVFDERPPELIAKEDYKNNGKWKVIADDGFTSSLSIQRTDGNGKVSRSAGTDSTIERRKRVSSDHDLSPQRDKRVNRKKVGDVSSTTKYESTNRNDHRPRSSRFTDASPKRRRNSSSHSSPVSHRRSTLKSIESPPRRKKIKEEPLDKHSSTPQRKVKQEVDSDDSPPRRMRSPKGRRDSDSDQSPPRKRMNYSDSSPPKRKIKQEPDSDVSPPRRRRSRSPNRRGYSRSSTSRKDLRFSKSPYNRSKQSPHRRYIVRSPKISQSDQRKARSSSTEARSQKLVRTLDGKVAGLQNAIALRVENDQFKKREEELFNKMSSDMSGRHAEAVVRDRKTGRIRDLDEEAAREHEKLVKEQERKTVYDKWGKGLKQVEDYRSRLQDDLHEINKPLARYSDDKDLEEMLKKQERDGDPMLNYIRNKVESRADATPSKPIYRGAYPENRFGIRPGYRWDGVDRSNGFETKWFNVQSKRKAGEEEAYKYSTEDM